MDSNDDVVYYFCITWNPDKPQLKSQLFTSELCDPGHVKLNISQCVFHHLKKYSMLTFYCHHEVELK